MTLTLADTALEIRADSHLVVVSPWLLVPADGSWLDGWLVCWLAELGGLDVAGG